MTLCLLVHMHAYASVLCMFAYMVKCQSSAKVNEWLHACKHMSLPYQCYTFTTQILQRLATYEMALDTSFFAVNVW